MATEVYYSAQCGCRIDPTHVMVQHNNIIDMWTHMDAHGQTWTHMGRRGHTWTNMDRHGQTWTHMCKHTQTDMDTHGHV